MVATRDPVLELLSGAGQVHPPTMSVRARLATEPPHATRRRLDREARLSHVGPTAGGAPHRQGFGVAGWGHHGLVATPTRSWLWEWVWVGARVVERHRRRLPAGGSIVAEDSRTIPGLATGGSHPAPQVATLNLGAHTPRCVTARLRRIQDVPVQRPNAQGEEPVNACSHQPRSPNWAHCLFRSCHML